MRRLGTPARLRRARKAATPAFVCVSTSMGLLCLCAMSVSAINCVFHTCGGCYGATLDSEKIDLKGHL
jgi:hypothetical protein